MDEEAQAQVIIDAALATANDLSASGAHVPAMRIIGLVLFARTVWAKLHPELATPPQAEPAK